MLLVGSYNARIGFPEGIRILRAGGGAVDAIEPAGDVVARIVREAHAVITGRLAQLVEPRGR